MKTFTIRQVSARMDRSAMRCYALLWQCACARVRKLPPGRPQMRQMRQAIRLLSKAKAYRDSFLKRVEEGGAA